ncbi:MAG: C40 family peptidase [Steroidobacteraceae bacterium]
MRSMRGYTPLVPLLLGALLLSGCVGMPRGPDRTTHGAAVSPTGQLLATHAAALLGRPYRFGGNGPEAFDCSGLVSFVHRELGIDVPRTTAGQFRAAHPVVVEALQPGDLLFFRMDGPQVAHVGIYVGERRFIHAPQSGRPVETRSLDDRFYHSRLLRAGRLYPVQ